MRWSLPALVGLVLHAAPLGAQDYIDLEAERRQQQEAAAETAAPEPLYPEAADTELADTAAVPAAGDASAIRRRCRGGKGGS